MGESQSTKISKNQTAKVQTKSGKDYSYKYVDIAQIHDYLESINARYIQQIQRIENDDYVMTKRCFDNKWEEEWLQGCKVVDATLVGVNNPAQEQGSALTYARRYSLLMAFGLATDDDDAQSLSKPKDSKVQPIKQGTNKNVLTAEQKERFELMVKLTNLIEEKGADREKVLGYYGVKSDTEMTTDQLKKAVEDVSKLKKKEN